jgi:TonB family protein
MDGRSARRKQSRRTRERASNLLIYGFAASIAAHVLLLPLAGLHAMHAAESASPPDLTVDTRAIPSPPPTPVATPEPRPTAPPRAAARAALRARPAAHRPGRPATAAVAAHGPAALGDDGPGEVDGSPGPAAESAVISTAPAATATPLACSRPDVAAATLRALEPELPALAQQQGVSGTVDVVVTLDASSRIVAARIAHSPSALLDAAALAAVRGSVFSHRDARLRADFRRVFVPDRLRRRLNVGASLRARHQRCDLDLDLGAVLHQTRNFDHRHGRIIASHDGAIR